MALREIYASFGIDFDTGPLVAGDNAVTNLIGGFQNLAGLLAGSAVVGAVRSFAHEFVGLADSLTDTAAALGLSSRELQQWRLAAQLNGATAQQIESAMVRLSDAIGSNNPRLRQMGIRTRDASGQLRATSEIALDLADHVSGLGSDAERNAALIDLFGRSGARLGPLFSRGAAGIRETMGELDALGGGVTPEAAEASARLGDAWDRLDTATVSLQSRLAVLVLPAVERFTVAITDLTAAFARVSDRGRILEATFVTLGAAAVLAGRNTILAWTRAAAPFVLVGAAVLGLILIVEDLWVAFEGGDSVIADLSETVQAWSESATGWVRGVADAWQFLRGIILSTIQLIGEVGGVDLLSGGSGDVAIAGMGGTAADREVDREVSARRAQWTASDGTLGQLQDWIPDSFERFLAERAVRTGEGRVSQVTNAPQITVNASGLTEAEATRVATEAVRRGMSSAAADAEDDLGQ